MKKNQAVLGMVIFLFLLPCNARAQNSTDYTSMPPPAQQDGLSRPAIGAQVNGPARVPPQLAIDVCKSKSEGTACEFTGPNGTKQGVCAYTPDKKYYACKPNDMRQQR